MTLVMMLANIALSLFAQQKGATPISSQTGGGREGATYAVVIGISDYQDDRIPDLHFADRDAEAFANFLRYPAGGSLDGDHLKVLLNEEASMAQFANALPVLKKAIALDTTFANPPKHLGMVCFKTNRSREAGQNFQKAIELNPNYAPARLGMAYLLHSEGKTTEAIGYVEQAIGKGSTFGQLEKDEDLAPLRGLPEWKDLMKKYFPDQVKD
jgi:tetratricopeptide (TPR) repeat protein